MGLLINRKNPTAISTSTHDPFFQTMDDFLSSFWGRHPATLLARNPDMRADIFTPHIEVSQKDDRVKVSAELPGLTEDDIHLHLEHDALVIEGEKKFEIDEDKDGRHYSERRYGHFRRAVEMPFDIDKEKVSAKFKKGVLTVDLQKAPEAKEKTRRISIST